MISIFLAEDHLLVREFWREALGNGNDFKIIGESDSAEEAYAMILDKRPDIILVDINLKGGSSVNMIKEICNVLPHPRIIVVSMNTEYAFIKKIFSYGIKGYVTKFSPKSDLIEAVYKVYNNETYFCSEVRKLFLEKKGDNEVLSFKELEILQLISKGYGNKQIASLWNVSVKAIENHKTKIYKKLKLGSISELIAYGKSKGMDM